MADRNRNAFGLKNTGQKLVSDVTWTALPYAPDCCGFMMRPVLLFLVFLALLVAARIFMCGMFDGAVPMESLFISK